jgi:hypothetical protein
MNKFLFTVMTFMSFFTISYSQGGKTSITGNSYIYCEILGAQKLLSPKVTVNIDFGQNTRFGEDTRLRGEDGKVIVFNSMVDAMNWMGSQGWEFVQAYVVTIGQQNVYHWLLKLDTKYLTPEEFEEIKSMFKTKRDTIKEP